MAKLLIEMAESVDDGLPLAIVTYHLEGYYPLIFSAWIIFKRLDSKVGTVGDETFQNVERVVTQVKQLLKEAREVHLSANDVSNVSARGAAWIVDICTEELCNIQHAGSIRSGAGGRSSSRKSARAVQNYSSPTPQKNRA